VIAAAPVSFASVTAPRALRAPERAEPTASELAARSRAAAGGERKAEAERERWLVHSGGLTGTLDVVRLGADSAATLLLGPFRTERGVWHGQRWHRNDNGETIVERAEPSQTERALAENVVRVREPVDGWAVNTTYASGHVLRSFYDARTSLVVRTERSANGHTVITTYDDFRAGTGGRTRATHYFGSDDRFGTDFDYRLASDGTAPAVDPRELAIPPDRSLVDFPAGAPSVRLPARIENGRVYVQLSIGGRALDFLLDSGASNITLDDRVARSLGLVGYGRSTETVAGTFATQRVIVPNVRIGALALRDVVMRTAPIAENEGTRTRVVGLLGFDFLDAAGVKIDYAAGTVDALPPGVLVAPPGSVSLELRLGGQVPVTTVTVGEATGDDFIVDTGAEFDLVLFQRFLRGHAETAHALPLPRVRIGNAIGGSVPYRALELRGMTLGPLAFSNLDSAVAVPSAALGFDTKDGLVGAGVLDRFTVFFDFAASRLYLAPAGQSPASARAQRSKRAPRETPRAGGAANQEL
jgi:predicted aspartyl protease